MISSFLIYDKNRSSKGEVELVMSIEDFGDIVDYKESVNLGLGSNQRDNKQTIEENTINMSNNKDIKENTLNQSVEFNNINNNIDVDAKTSQQKFLNQ